MKVSIVVCTYNRAVYLHDCLQSIIEQKADKSLFEVVVVDNNSTDNTLTVASKFSCNFPHYKVVTEKKQGLSHARNRGWQEAAGDYVAYIDDDAIAFPDWAETMFSFIKRQPEIKAFGGPYFGYSLIELPKWIPAGFGTHSLGDDERPIFVGQEWISGSNMVFAKQLLQDLSGFRTDLGMSGNKISYGEETELVKRISNLGFVVYYLPSMKVNHLIPEYKMSLRWMLRAAYANGRCSAKMVNQSRPLIWSFYLFLRALVKTLNIFNPVPWIPFKRKVFFSIRPLVASLGAMKECWMITLGKESIDL